MTIDRALATATALSIALVLLIGGSLVITDERSLLYDAEKREIEKTAVVLTTAMNQAATLSATHSELLSVDPNVIRMMTAGARDELRPTASRSSTASGAWRASTSCIFTTRR